MKDSLVFEDDVVDEERLDETEALFLMANETFLWASASFGLRVVERRTGALISGLLLLLFISSSDLRFGSEFCTTTLISVETGSKLIRYELSYKVLFDI